MKGASGVTSRELGLGLSYMPRQCSPIWKTAFPGWREALDSTIEGVAEGGLPPIFFRADNIGAGGQAFDALCRLFRHYRAPLAMAVVPAWLSPARQERMFNTAPIEEDLWSWHQHGWRHINRQKSGPEGEFGCDRPLDLQYDDISQGRQKMETIFGPYFVPVFSPPWSLFSTGTLKILRNLEFRGLCAVRPPSPAVKLPGVLLNLPLRVNLHPQRLGQGDAYHRLLGDLAGLAKVRAPAGILIHHQRMSPFAFEFLDRMLYNLKYVAKAQFYGLREMLNDSDEKQACARLR